MLVAHVPRGAALVPTTWPTPAPLKNHLTDKVTVDGKETDVVSPDGVADRADMAGRVLPGRRRQRPRHGGAAALRRAQLAADRGRRPRCITALLAVIVGILAGFFRGWVDGVISRALDVIWAFPVILLGVALGTALSLGGLSIGPAQDQRRTRG